MLAKLLICCALMGATRCQFNPSILKDARQEPRLDGTFGFLYQTEDGIAHAAKADPGGAVHGRFTYTDPTGLIVNFNYNAGSGVTPKYNYDAPANPQPQQQYRQPQQEQQQQQQQQPAYNQYQQQPQPQYEQPRHTKPPALRNYDNYDGNNQNYNDPYANNVNNYDTNQYY